MIKYAEMAEERDLDQMAAIEAVSIPGGWTGADFAEALANRQALLLLLTEEESGEPSEEKSRMRGAAREADREGQTVLAYLVCYFAGMKGRLSQSPAGPGREDRGLPQNSWRNFGSGRASSVCQRSFWRLGGATGQPGSSMRGPALCPWDGGRISIGTQERMPSCCG